MKEHRISKSANTGRRSKGQAGNETITVWVPSGRDQAQILRNLTSDSELVDQGISANIQLIAAGSILPAVLAGTAPDVVLIGESREPDTLRGMIESAEIGVAAYSTVHTRSVPETLSRIINGFPIAERLQITATLISSLRLIISQRLVPLPDNSGRTALREYLAFTPEIRETLLNTPLERLIPQAEDLLSSSGQRIQDAAKRAYAGGNIGRDIYQAILAERKARQNSPSHALALEETS